LRHSDFTARFNCNVRSKTPGAKKPRLKSSLAEGLEERRFFDGQAVSVSVQYAPQFTLPANAIAYEIPSGFSTTVSGQVARAVVEGGPTAPDFAQITGAVTIQWYQGPAVAVIGLTNDDTTDPQPVATVPTAPITLNQADAGTPIASGPYAGDYILLADYSGSADFTPTQSDVATELSEAGNSALSFGLNVIRFTGGLSFVKQPGNAEAGDDIAPPIQVAVDSDSGSVDTTSNDLITLSIGTGSGTLSGKLTEPAVKGVATFKDVSIDTGGDYTLTATDAKTGQKGTSKVFSITGGKLVFLKQPATSIAGHAVKPTLQVALKNGKNQTIKSADGTEVDLNLIGFASANPITGNSAVLVNGVATFSNVVLTTPAVYQLQASDGTDAAATSHKFKVSAPSSHSTKQPALDHANAPSALSTPTRAASPNTAESDDGAALANAVAPFESSIAAVLAEPYIRQQ